MSVFAKDRCYYRCLYNADLVEEAKRGVNVDWQELAMVLAERLQTDMKEYECPLCGA